MLKIVLHVTLLLATVVSRFVGDSCMAEGQLGLCVELSLCPALEKEIRAAGSPMPTHMVMKLQQLTCGFQNTFGSMPLVCCVETESPTDWPNDQTPPDNGDIYNRPVWGGGTQDKQGTAPEEDKTNMSTDDGPPDITNHPNLRKLPTNCGNMDAYKISGGNRTALYEMPWMVLLYYNTSRDTNLNCGGTLINEWYVLTAAHCVAFLGDRMQLDHVILGEWDVRTDPDCEMVEGSSPKEMEEACAPKKRDVRVTAVIPHAGYKPQTLVDDIALIRLAEPADLSLDTMAAICLPVTRELQRTNLVGQAGVVAGWGVTEFGLQSPVLLSVNLPVISNEDCQQAYRGSPRIHDRQMCAGGESDKDSCGGDSGGPLLFPGNMRSGGVKQVQRGIVSFGSKRCGVGGVPGVYTNVAYYMDWILNNIR